MVKCQGYTFIPFILMLYSFKGAGAMLRPLGCYQDNDVARDLNRKKVAMGFPNLNLCSKSCRNDGYPYVGLQDQKWCFCGDSYGTYGRSTRCNVTCSPLPCGGPLDNNVYYSLSSDPDTLDKREIIVHQAANTWKNARETCVMNNGDLVATKTPDEMTTLVDTITEIGINGSRIWLGLWRRLPDLSFEWANPTKMTFHGAEYAEIWKEGEDFSEDCIALSVVNKKIETSPCSEQLPFACDQIPYQPTEQTTTEVIEETTEKPGWSETQKKVFYIILPLFIFVYGGSCLFYTIHKLLRAWRNKKHKRVRVRSDFYNFNSDKKPLNVGAGSSGSFDSHKKLLNGEDGRKSSARLPPHYKDSPVPGTSKEEAVSLMDFPPPPVTQDFETTVPECYRSDGSPLPVNQRPAKTEDKEHDERFKEAMVHARQFISNRNSGIPNRKASLMSQNGPIGKFTDLSRRHSEFTPMPIASILQMKLLEKKDRQARARKIVQA